MAGTTLTNALDRAGDTATQLTTDSTSRMAPSTPPTRASSNSTRPMGWRPVQHLCHARSRRLGPQPAQRRPGVPSAAGHAAIVEWRCDIGLRTAEGHRPAPDPVGGPAQHYGGGGAVVGHAAPRPLQPPSLRTRACPMFFSIAPLPASRSSPWSAPYPGVALTGRASPLRITMLGFGPVRSPPRRYFVDGLHRLATDSTWSIHEACSCWSSVTALAFMAPAYLLRLVFGSRTAVYLILLILQITACGGTLPARAAADLPELAVISPMKYLSMPAGSRGLNSTYWGASRWWRSRWCALDEQPDGPAGASASRTSIRRW